MACNRGTRQGAISIIDSEITRINDQLRDISVPEGSELPFSPDLSGSLRARYDFHGAFDGQTNAYVSVGNCGTYDAPSFSPNGRYVQDSYVFLDLAFGVERDNWSAELFVDNVTDKRAQLHVDTLQYVPKVVTNRPRNIGLRVSCDFG